MTSSRFNQIKWLIPLVLISISVLVPLTIAGSNARKSNLLQRITSLRDHRTKGLLLSRLNSNPNKSLISRQGPGSIAAVNGLGSILSSGPMLLALSSLLFSFPVLPMLFLAPMAISNFLPNMDDVADPSINDILQSVQNIGQGLGLLNKPITGSTSAGSTSSSSSASGSSSSGALASSPTSSSSSSDSTGSLSQSGSSSSSATSNIISALGSASEPIASIVAAPSSSSSSSSSSSPPKATLNSPSADSLADLSTGFLSQLAAINEILSNNNNPSSENPMTSFSQLAANTLSSLSNLLFSARREESTDKKVNKFRLPFAFGPLRKSTGHSIVTRSAPNTLPYLQARGAFTDRLAALRLQTLWSRSSGVIVALVKRLREMYSTFREGLKRYEISESECQARLICELNQKAVGRSARNWAKVLIDFIRFDERLESLGMGGMTKSTLIDFYQAARKGMSDEECASAYSRCPVSIAVEPVNNSIMGKLFRRMRFKQSASSSPIVQSTDTNTGNIMITGNQVYTPGVSSSASSLQSLQSTQSSPSQLDAIKSGKRYKLLV